MTPSFCDRKALLRAITQGLPDPDFNVSRLAEKLFLSERSLHRLTKLLFKCPPNKIIRELRLRKARRLIRTGEVSTVAEVAIQVGFLHTGYFSNLYKERFGSRPAEDIRLGIPA